MSTDTRPKMQVFYGVDNPSRIKKPEPTGSTLTTNDQRRTSLPASLNSQIQQSQNPVVNLIQDMQKVQTNTPEAKLNKDTMGDNNGGRITFNDELTRSQTFKGVEDPSSLPIKKR